MARPKQNTPTVGELEILHVLWNRGPSTVRDVLNQLNRRRPRAYTSIMTLLNVMFEKGLVHRQAKGRAFLYRARRERSKTLGKMVQDLLGRAFEGSASALITNVLTESKPSAQELREIQRAIGNYLQDQKP